MSDSISHVVDVVEQGWVRLSCTEPIFVVEERSQVRAPGVSFKYGVNCSIKAGQR